MKRLSATEQGDGEDTGLVSGVPSACAPWK